MNYERLVMVVLEIAENKWITYEKLLEILAPVCPPETVNELAKSVIDNLLLNDFIEFEYDIVYLVDY